MERERQFLSVAVLALEWAERENRISRSLIDQLLPLASQACRDRLLALAATCDEVCGRIHQSQGVLRTLAAEHASMNAGGLGRPN